MSNSVLCRLLAVACILFRGATPPGGGSRSGPLDVVGPRSRYTRYSTAAGGATSPSATAGGGCDLMSHRPICSRFGQIFTAKILDIVCWKLLHGQRIKKINKLLISANDHGQRITLERLRRPFPRVHGLDHRCTVQ